MHIKKKERKIIMNIIRKSKIYFSCLICILTIFSSIKLVNASGTISKTKKNDVGYLQAQNTLDKWAGYNHMQAVTTSTASVNKLITKGSLKLNSTGEQLWSGNRSDVGTGVGYSLNGSTNKGYSGKVVFYTTHETIHSKSTVLYISNTAS